MGISGNSGSANRAHPEVRPEAVGHGETEALRLIEAGNVAEGEGRFADALCQYDAAVRVAPDFAPAHLNRGNALFAMDELQRAADAYEIAVARSPRYAAAHFNLGNATARLGRPAAAITAFRNALSLQPEFVDAEAALGATLEDLGQFEEAASHYERALTLDPDYAEIHHNLGLLLRRLERVADAVVCFRRAVGLRPDFSQAHYSLGIALRDLGERAAALASFRQTMATLPESAQAFNDVGTALRQLGALADALACYRRAVAIDPQFVDAINNLSMALTDAGQHNEAATCLDRALAIAPDTAELHCNLGTVRHALRQFDAAAASFRRAIALKPDLWSAHNNLGMALTELGDLRGAIASLERALAERPDDPEVHSNLLFVHSYLSDRPAADLLAAARRFGDLAARRSLPYTYWANVADPQRRLRVGFVSGDFRHHPVSYFAEGTFAALAAELSSELELVGYPCSYITDEITARIKARCHEWHMAAGLTDEQLAERIRADRIDILVDLAGHTACNRLTMFAWKPAPVQVTWLGYFATTGVTDIDYLIADPWCLPESEEGNYTEKIWRLPDTRFCFSIPEVDVDAGPLPALRNGYVTFGCFNHLAKMGPEVVAVWAEILRALPGSRLRLKSAQFEEPSVRRAVGERFAIEGITQHQLELEVRAPLADYLAAYRRVDIALDPFPYSGGSTTSHALWMGVPVLTLAGDRLVSRQGVGLLQNAGLADWIATDTRDYVGRALRHAGDLRRLAALRELLRNDVKTSPIFDASRFASQFASALRAMWLAWCERQRGSPLRD